MTQHAVCDFCFKYKISKIKKIKRPSILENNFEKIKELSSQGMIITALSREFKVSNLRMKKFCVDNKINIHYSRLRDKKINEYRKDIILYYSAGVPPHKIAKKINKAKSVVQDFIISEKIEKIKLTREEKIKYNEEYKEKDKKRRRKAKRIKRVKI
ncbi:MAG: hypothetical protein LBQ24_00495 [Candidatus Peribacteria bacterium]|jgi:hypothetical protein|nr:hypothetical protein [Candidatus Peribacteria bacterium]